MKLLSYKAYIILPFMVCLLSASIAQRTQVLPQDEAYADSLFQLIPKVKEQRKIEIYRALLDSRNKIGEMRIKIGRAAFKFAQEIGNHDLAAFAIVKSSLPLINAGQFQEAEQKLKVGADYYQKLPDKKMYVTSLILLGYSQNRQQFSTEALRYYLEALLIAEEIGDLQRINNLNNRIINIYLAKNEYRKALQYATLIQKNCLGKSFRCPFYTNSLNHLSKCYLGMGQLDSARLYINQYFKIVGTERKAESVQQAYLRLSELRTEEGNLDAAILYADSALTLANLNKRSMGIVNIHNHLSSLYQAKKERAKEEFHLKKGLQLSEQFGFLGYQRQALQSLWDFYASQNQPMKALLYADQWRIINDSLREVERQNSVKRQDELIAQQKQQAKLQLFEKEQVKQQSNNQLLIAISIFLLSLLGLTVYFLRLRRQLNNRLKLKNEQLGESVKERDTLLKEIHHRVKNNLQIISSLLNLQMRHVKSGEAKEALSEGRNRVRSIALIHQNLYQDFNFREIRSQKYIHSLLENIQATFRHKSVTLVSEIEDLLLPEEIMTQIGLIINESVTNAYKHAFPDEEKGRIELKLVLENNHLLLSIQDNGKGLPPDFDIKNNTTFGLLLISDFATRLSAQFSLISTYPGTLLKLSIPEQTYCLTKFEIDELG